MIITSESFPELRAVFEMIERDNGGHLIGTVYPGDRINFEAFNVPDAWALLLPQAEAGLARLRSQSEDDFETFVNGEESEQAAIFERQGDLAAAQSVLMDYFNGWQPEDAPNKGAEA